MKYRCFYTSYGQMYLVEKWAPEVGGQGAARRIAYTWYDLPSVSGQSFPSGAIKGAFTNGTAQNDCPKFATRQEWAVDWSRDDAAAGLKLDDVAPSTGNYVAKYVYQFAKDVNGYLTYARTTDALGRIYRTDVSSDNLTHTSRVWTNEAAYGTNPNPNFGAALKTTTTVYANIGGNLQVASVTISDGSNTRKTAYSYTNVNGMTLPSDVTEYQADTTTTYRHTVTNYVTDTTYSNLYIFGLPLKTLVYAGAGTGNLVSGTEYSYDEAAYFEAGTFSVVQHNGATQATGRANLTTVKQYNAPSASTRDVSHTKYDRTGMPVFVKDAANNTNWFYYDDNFSDAVNRNTHALVTKVKDADGYWSGTQYNWYMRGPSQTYHIAGTSGTGAHENITSYGYDSYDRPNLITRPDGGQTMTDYWDNWLAMGVYTTLDTGLTQYSFTAYDGAGHMRWQGADNLNAVADKYRATLYQYDAAGRTIKASLETAVNGWMAPIDDDDPAQQGYGILYRTITYDALDRQTQVTHAEGNAVKFDYAGCGCAGTQTVTVEDERHKKRRQIYDHFGRLAEAQELDVTNPVNPTVYSRAKYFYDERDLLQRIEHSGSNAAQYQLRTFQYDGYGRLLNQTTPEAGTISYTYKPNDLVETVSNQRPVAVTFSYNGRNLVTDVNYSDSTHDVHYQYGEYGERTVMQEKSGATVVASTSYGYDNYKRLNAETRNFDGLSGTYKVEYDYNKADALKWVKYTVNSWVKQVNYAYNSAGGMSSVGTNLIGGDANTNIASGFEYRGFGGVKRINYGNGQRLIAGYSHHRQHMTSLSVQKTDTTSPVFELSYDYYNGGGGNGRLQKVTDILDPGFTTTYTYDHYNRLTNASASNYTRSYTYDAWGNLRTASGTGLNPPGYTLNYHEVNGVPTTNRVNNTGYDHDNTGNLTDDGWTSYTYDAANRLKAAGAGNNYEYDGDGRKVKHQAGGYNPVYYLWSSVLNQPVVEIVDSISQPIYRAHVYSAGGQRLALQSYQSDFYWVHSDHLGSGRGLTTTTGEIAYRGEFDPYGEVLLEVTNLGATTFSNNRKFTGYERDWATGLDDARARTYASMRGRFMQADPLGLGAADVTNPQSLNLYSYVGNDPINGVDPSGMLMDSPACYVDGIESSCGLAFRLVQSGAGVFGPANTTRWNPRLFNGQGGWEHFAIDANGNGGWGYLEQTTTNILDDKDNVVESITGSIWHWTKQLGSLTNWQGQLAFDLVGVIRDYRGSIIGERPIQMEMLGPVDFVGVGGIRNVGVGLVGQTFGKLGTVVSNPALRITSFSGHAVNQAITRQVTTATILGTVRSPAVVLAQANGGKFLFLSDAAAVVLDRGGRVVTVYGAKDFQSGVIEVLKAAGVR